MRNLGREFRTIVCLEVGGDSKSGDELLKEEEEEEEEKEEVRVCLSPFVSGWECLYPS